MVCGDSLGYEEPMACGHPMACSDPMAGGDPEMCA